MSREQFLDPRLLDAVADAWERGWRPADLVHAVGRSAPSLAGLAAAVAVASVELLGAERAVPAEWDAQVHEVRRQARGATAPGDDVHQLWLQVRLLPPLPRLAEVPSRWPPRSVGGAREAAAPGHVAGAGAAARALRRIRALLAKAESTDFPEEAEALTAKAQELMAQHAIDAVLVAAAATSRPGGPGAAAPEVAERRMHLEAPYLDAKMHLVSAVAEANGVRTAWFASLGIAVLIGMPADLDAVELLVTSLLVQAGRAVQAAGRHGGAHSRSRGFRRAFLLAYAVRVGERLEAAHRTGTADATAAASARGTDLAPVLRDREAAVARTFDDLFPRLRRRRTTSVDRTGWLSGRAAADAADLARRRPLPS
ncbi:DUF2786 domain-containing protein [Trujillonella endophytica]|nr:DUF2786 domain-containing protein [Trujillella endophytica]